jgi:hypothetical protein
MARARLTACDPHARRTAAAAAPPPPPRAQAFGSILQTTLYPLLVVSRNLEFSEGAAVHANAQAFWLKTRASLLALSPAIDDVQIAPYGLVTNIYPLVTTRRNATAVIAMGGHDLMNASSPVANRRAAALLALTSRELMIEGPKSLLLPDLLACVGRCNGVVDPLLGLLARLAIYVPSNSSVDEWAGNTTWPGVLPGQTLGPVRGATNCTDIVNPATGLSYCDTNGFGDGTRFWGFSTVIVIWKQLLDLARVTDLGDVNGRPYRWSVARSSEATNGTGDFPWTFTSNNGARLPTANYERGVVATVKTFSSVWAFTVEKPGGWEPVWADGIIAGVVLISALIALFTFLLLLERSLHLDLLYSMLPKRMVTKMRESGGGFAESFDHVVVLFSARPPALRCAHARARQVVLMRALALSLAPLQAT